MLSPTYLAMMELIDNFDDIDGSGNNTYLWYDAATRQFTIVPWDMNRAFGGALGGGDGSGGFQLPKGVQPPAGFQLPDGAAGTTGWPYDPRQRPRRAFTPTPTSRRSTSGG